MSSQHANYEILNMIGYGLAKFNTFAEVFGFTTKTAFYDYCVKIRIAETTGVVKNRQDLFDPYFDNSRRGWWQKSDAYIHRKIKIDTLFGNENVESYVNIVKLYMQTSFGIKDFIIKVNPIIQTRFKQMQETGLEAELFFMNNYQNINQFQNGKLEDARLFGDGYDFQISVDQNFYLAEIKGIRGFKGKLRLTENEYQKAREYKTNYFLTVVFNLNENPMIKTFSNPLQTLDFKKVERQSKPQTEYHLIRDLF